MVAYVRAAMNLCFLKAMIRSVPGRSQESWCRHCNEYETLPHVLGFCRKGELLRNNQHHWVRSRIAECLKKSEKFDVYEEVHCISCTGSTKRADIIAIDNNQKIGFIIDPTIRFEGAELQPQEVDLEKKIHYEPCFPYLKEKYHIPVCRWEVIGLLFGGGAAGLPPTILFCRLFAGATGMRIIINRTETASRKEAIPTTAYFPLHCEKITDTSLAVFKRTSEFRTADL
ncbi:hypothetical protein ANN_26172 [Periplaneta americana]|uniref:Reverse transcriptase zinc-binding domain-containing protein n=1 Tax=Periplaneta americana TaxID=6978 RepID=A0ABQ8S5L3_PERAM|nr:hypothetical protein ANN_26172 [Periplaneta americana]